MTPEGKSKRTKLLEEIAKKAIVTGDAPAPGEVISDGNGRIRIGKDQMERDANQHDLEWLKEQKGEDNSNSQQ